ncbi:hypothetical protein [Streptomyces aureocirculatus]|uniref:hypothetical protein n=1 Tax=Streptomyces aureocirculatus TaxID=67275 RepID=UPI000AE1C137|nr:hypothetical protein [Streptomyces aureocirculatus]
MLVDHMRGWNFEAASDVASTPPRLCPLGWSSGSTRAAPTGTPPATTTARTGRTRPPPSVADQALINYAAGHRTVTADSFAPIWRPSAPKPLPR